MAWTQTDIDNLKATIATGTLTVIYDGPPKRQITYQSAGQMLEILAQMQDQVNRANNVSTVRLASTSKGL